MNQSELQQHLSRLDLTPSRKLGQSFLVDQNISRWISSQLQVKPDDCVVEVGPGFGALTEHLVGKVRRLILVEKDGRLAEFLEEKFGGDGVEVIHADATEFDIRPLFLEGSVKLIGNLPYSCGNEILRRFLDAPSPVSSAIIMVQKEVADRFVAKPGSKDYGILGLMLQERWETTNLRTIGSTPFHPRPAVDSSIVRFDPRPSDDLPMHSPEVFASTVKQGFSQRRKQLHNNLQVEKETALQAFDKLGLKSSVRAEEVNLEQWVSLSNLLDPHPCSDLPPSATELLDVVDEQDKVIGQRTRKEIHEEKLLHRAIHIFLQNKSGDEIYLQKRSHLKDSHPCKWDSSASGHLDAGEDYGVSAVRELWEEVWVKPKGELTKILKLDACDETDQEFVEVYLAEAKGRIRVHGKEVDSGRFFPLALLDEWVEKRPQDFARAFVYCYQKWRLATRA